MALEVVGSTPTTHPTNNLKPFGVSPSGKARDFDSRIRKFKSCHPSQREVALMLLFFILFDILFKVSLDTQLQFLNL